MAGWMRTLLFFAFAAVAATGAALAPQQDEPAQAEVGGQGEQQPEAAGAGIPVEMDDQAGEDAGEETEEDDEEFERFDPSENLSADSGVSFPADI